MIVDGKKVAEAIYENIRAVLGAKGTAPCLTVFTCAPNSETRKFLELKQRRAAENGIDMVLIEFDAGVSIEEAERAIWATTGTCEGVIVQLPFPAHIDAERLIKAIPEELDVDVLRYAGEETDVLPPVVGAIAAIAAKYEVDFAGKQVVVVGRGRLVGKPAALWAKAQQAYVTVIDKDTPEVAALLGAADIIISGAGVPGLIAPDHVKDGVIIFDAGTSEAGGQLRGDADPACAQKAALFTPVPGGIGPVTVAMLLQNLITIAFRNS